MFSLIDMVIVRPIVNLLFVIYNFVGDFGLAIIIFTILVKLLMWPLMKRQLHQTKLMRKIQPELAEIKKNCKGNRQMESLQMMDLYKRHNIKPFRSVITLLIQLPIFFALFISISAMVNPRPDNGTTCGYTNVTHCAYPAVLSMDRIKEISEKQTAYLEERSEEDNKIIAPDNNAYDFHPQLFGLVNLDARAGFNSISSIVILGFALLAALMQYLLARQQMPSNKSKKSRSFRQILKEAANGEEPDQSELNTMVSGQMSKMMPIMMLFIMIPLPGALVFYYLLTNLITVAQQRFIFKRDNKEMESSTDKAILKELHQKEKELGKIKNAHITRITAKDTKKKRRK